MTIPPRLSSAPGRSARAFTLIELLTVVAVIGVLAALIMPAISSAKRSGIEMKSVSRLRDLQTANIQFAFDNNQTYVPAWDMASNNAWFTNPLFLRYLVGPATSGYWWGNSPVNVYSPLVPLAFSQSLGSSYGLNDDNENWPPNPRRMLSDVPVPAEMMAFAESQDWLVTNAGAQSYKSGPEVYRWSAIAYRYNNLANVVYFDGHVGTLSMQQVAGNTLLWDGH